MSNIRPVPYETAVAVFGQLLDQSDAIDRAIRCGDALPVLTDWKPRKVGENSGQPWTAREDALCLRLWAAGETLADIATTLHRTINATSRRLDELRWELAEPRR